MEEKTKEDVVTEEQQPKVTLTDSQKVDYEALKTIRENTVPKKEYDEILEKYKNVMQDFAAGKSPATEEAQAPVDLDKLREKVFSQEVNNLEYWQNAIALRDELIKRGERDPFLPYGKNITPTYEDTEAAERVASVVKQCIEYADGDSLLFTQELQRRTNDVRIRR